MLDGLSYAIVALNFLLAGIVKGILGLGLSTVSLSVLAVSLGLQPAMALLLAPSFVTHVWHAVAGGQAGAILARLWLFMLAAVSTIWLGVSLSSSLRMWALMALLGFLLLAYSITGLFGSRISIPKRRALWLGPLAGILNGIFTGLTGAFEAPGAWYFRALGLTRNQLVQAVAMLCIASTAGLAVSLNEQRLLTTELAVVSVGAVAPAVIGMVLGQRLRKKIPQARFRRVYFVALLALGIYILTQSL